MVIEGALRSSQVPSLRNTETLFDPEFATATSRLPSPLRSATAMDAGFVPPEARLFAARNPVGCARRRMDTLLEP